MKGFQDYLITHHITIAQYIPSYINLIKSYLLWLAEQGKNIENADYQNLIDYLNQLEKIERSVHYRNRFLLTLTHYYTYKGLPNLAKSTRIKSIHRTQPQQLLTDKELDMIYNSYENQARKNYYYHTDKLVLGLVIYQGLNMQDFMKIELEDLNLKKGILYVKSGRQLRERHIPLEAHQIIALYEYIHHKRSSLMKEESNLLFAPQALTYNRTHWQFKELSKLVKAQIKEKLGIEILKMNQLRQSRIAIWVKEKGIREAQYLAGFRRVMSAERYKNALLEDLKEQVKLFHPLS